MKSKTTMPTSSFLDHADAALPESPQAPYPRVKEAKTYLSPAELKTIVRYLTSSNHHYFSKDNQLKVPFKHHLQLPDPTVALFRWSYPELCWHADILEKAGFTSGRQVLELGSGNNNLVTSPALTSYLKQLCSDTYVLSNYSGGRGDYFALQHLAQAISHRMRYSSGEDVELSHLHLCHTSGAQGGITGVADFFATFHQGQSVALADSTYCGMYAPLVTRGVPVSFIATEQHSKLPRVEEILAALQRPEIVAYFLIPFHNPSGECYSESEMATLCAAVQNTGKYLIVSEVYDGMNWNCSTDITSEIDRVVVNTGTKNIIRMFSLSKSRGLAGLRAGYVLSTEAICTHIAQVNALHSFNPPMINAKLLLLHELLSLHGRTRAKISDALEYLGISAEHFKRLFAEHSLERQTLNLQCLHNFKIVAERLLRRPITTDELRGDQSVISNEHYDIIIPRGGMNCSVRMKYLEQYDQIDLFRKTYLWSGLIMHTSRYLSKESGTWVRITLTHAPEVIEQGVETLIELESAHSHFDLEPQDTIVNTII